MRHQWIVIAVFWMAAVSAGWAAPAPLGLEIGKATVEEAKQRYRLQELGINKYSRGPHFRLDPSQVEMEGLQGVLLIFWPDGTLAGVLLTMNKFRFDEVVDLLSKKYRLISKDRPFVGNARAVLRDGDVEIRVEAPHLSFEMDVLYISDRLQRNFDEITRREEERQRAREASQL